jgi:hypothetical protein
MRTRFRFAILCATFCTTMMLCVASHSAARQSESGNTSAIACRVLEAHASANPAVTVIVFHQQRKEDQDRLGALLRSHSGESAEIQVGDAAWTGVTIFRLKSCFGRGLMVLPPGAPAMKDGSTFVLRFPASGGTR